MTTTYCFEKDIEKIENYELAKKDNFVGWVIHHRLETHFSNGENCPGEGFVLGRKTKGRTAWNKGKHIGNIPWNKGLKKE